MNDDLNPTCGKCGIAMTPENSTTAPEYFLCDKCAEKEGFPVRKKVVVAVDIHALRQVADPFRRALNLLDLLPQGYCPPDEQGIGPSLPRVWPTIGELRALIAAIYGPEYRKKPLDESR